MTADHEGLADLDSGAGTDGEKRFRLRNGEAEGLFAEDMLAGFGGFDGPGNVKLIGERIVDGVDIGIGEQLFVGAVGGWDAERGGRFLRLGEIAGCDGGHGGVLALLHGGKDFLEADGRGAEDSPRIFLRMVAIITADQRVAARRRSTQRPQRLAACSAASTSLRLFRSIYFALGCVRP